MIWNTPRFTFQNIILLGYWQSYLYFQGIAEQLKKELIPLNEMSQHYLRYAEQIGQTNSVMIHIRRGDYVSLPHVANLYATLPISYYQKATHLIQQKTGKCHFFLFSDDYLWVKKHFDFLENYTCIESEAGQSSVISELQLMARCRHHVLANSSLSWWGAWLAQYSGQYVICPHQWTKTTNQLDDLLPAQWIRLEP